MRAPLLSRSHRRRRGKVKYPIEIEFDGDEVDFFLGGWSEAGGNVLNDQIVLGSELVVNGDMELDSDWDDLGTPSTNERSAEQKNGGSFSRKYITDDDNEGIQSDAFSLTDGDWYSASGFLFSSSGMIFDIRDAGDETYEIFDGTPGAAFIQKILAFRALNTDNDVKVRCRSDSGITAYNDDFTLKQLALTSILNSLKAQFGLSDGFFIDVYINAVTSGTPVGIIWNLDDPTTPANFGMAYVDGTNLVVDKNVAGTYSNLASVAQAVTPDQILRIENPAGTNVLSIKYNGVEKATPTIADASVIGNTGIALFSTEANNAISKVTIGKL